MKKLILLLICSCVSLGLHAQNEHMKFMGITMNCTIGVFQNKLSAKGVRYNQKVSSTISAGCRAFNGTFSNEKAEIFVYYNEKTKIVYRAKAVITCSNEDIGKNKYNSFRQMLQEKYSEHIVKDEEHKGRPALSVLVFDSKFSDYIGAIDLYMTDPQYSFMDEVYLHIDYIDDANQAKNENKNMDDL